jgi:hypothetical protein
MFLFGFFSTNIPYFILASLYLVGFGVYSGNTLREKLFNKHENTHEISYAPNANTQELNNSKAVHYHNASSNFNNYLGLNFNEKLAFVKVQMVRVLPFEKKPYTDNGCYSFVFSRPPPAL